MEFDSDAAYETYMQERHRVQKRVHECQRPARDRSARTYPAREKQQAAAAAAAVQAPRPEAAVAPEHVMPEQLLDVVRRVWQHLGWLDTRKLFQMVGLHGKHGSCGQNPWLQVLPAELRNDEHCLVRLLPLARRHVRREREAAGLSTRSRAQTKKQAV